MNLHQVIRRNYGQNAVVELRHNENIDKKIVRFRNHRVFTLRCRDRGLTPPSLRLKCPINTQNARSIIEKAEKQLLCERLRVINNKLDGLNSENTESGFILNSRGYPDDLKQRISRHLVESREKEFQNVSARQKKKLDRLAEKQAKRDQKRNQNVSKHVDLDLSGAQLKRWVVNLSKYKTTAVQNKVLARGLNYAVSPETLDDPSITNEYIVACEKACWKLSKGDAAQLRAEVVGTIKSSKPPKSNVSEEERKALKTRRYKKKNQSSSSRLTKAEPRSS